MKTLLILVTVLAAAAFAHKPQWSRWGPGKGKGRGHSPPRGRPYSTSAPLTGSEGEWGYGPTNGPHTWPYTFPMCGGARQSPVALETLETIVKVPFETFQFTNYDVLPSAMTIANSGHAVEVRAPNLQASVTGGNLPDRYIFDMFHFHWGAVDTRGSEHTLDGKRYAGDIHLVHYRERYGNTSEAVKHKNGVAVLSLMLDVSPHHNPILEPIVSRLSSIRKSGDEASLPGFVFKDILPKNTGHFLRYGGSLTTPECNEGVIWTVFKIPIHISSNQLQAFRQLVAQDGSPLQDNFRTLQPLNGRKVYLAQLH